jgi:transcriptional regulator with XRE-family HTH domain
MASKTTFPDSPEQSSSTPSRRATRGKEAAQQTGAPRGRREAKQKLAKALGDSAREARQRTGLTQADVAERIGVATEVYGRLERGLLMPSVPTLRRLCLALHLTADALLALGPNPPSSAWTEAPAPTSDEDAPQMRRLMRHVRKLTPTQLRALSLVAATLRREQ